MRSLSSQPTSAFEGLKQSDQAKDTPEDMGDARPGDSVCFASFIFSRDRNLRHRGTRALI
jgi:hypothetical protein